MALTLLFLVGAALLLEVVASRPFLASLAGRALVAQLGAWRVEALLGGPQEVFVTPARAPRWTWLLVEPQALCCGRVVLVFGGERRHTPALERHERIHARQFGRWGSVAFLVAYLAGWLWALTRVHDARDAHYHVPFERAAFRAQYGPGWSPPGGVDEPPAV